MTARTETKDQIDDETAHTIAEVASIAYESLRQYRVTRKALPLMPAWDAVDETQKEDIIESIIAIADGEVVSPEQLHRQWCIRATEQGWTWGLVTDAEKKETPTLVPFRELGVDLRLEIILIFNTARTLLFHETLPEQPGGETRDIVRDVDLSGLSVVDNTLEGKGEALVFGSDAPWPAEVLLAFAAWLTGRDEIAGPFNKHHEPHQAIALVERFRAAQGWASARAGWPDRFRPFPQD